ncbi:MAG: hypothetical protein PVG39_09070 [Desulfobacteraceae bacterium]
MTNQKQLDSRLALLNDAPHPDSRIKHGSPCLIGLPLGNLTG